MILDGLYLKMKRMFNTSIGSTTDTNGSHSSGSVMGKLNKLLGQGEKKYIPSNSLRATVISTRKICDATTSLCKFEAQHSGVIRIDITLQNTKVTNSGHSLISFIGSHGDNSISAQEYTNSITTPDISIFDFFNKPVNTVFTNTWYDPFVMGKNFIQISSGDTVSHSHSYNIRVHKGETMVCLALVRKNMRVNLAVDSLKIYYDEVNV